MPAAITMHWKSGQMLEIPRIQTDIHRMQKDFMRKGIENFHDWSNRPANWNGLFADL